MTPLYKVGIYCRLSVDDANNSAKAKNYIPADESVSIENQRELLSKFVMLNGWIETKTYIDDGYSGGNFQRPGFLEMIEDARKGIINLILVKDLSRLGRDFVEVGRYTDYVFPSLGCRFVSVLDCLDTSGENTDMLHFRSLMNDYHLRDLSMKIKTVLHSKMASGQYLGSYAPYGYQKSAEDKHRLEIDPVAAETVRCMYEMRLSGMSYNKITGALNQSDTPAPKYYWNERIGRDNTGVSRLWLERSVKLILQSEVYLGNLIMNRTGSRSYKDKTQITKRESEWIRHEGIHEPIIEKSVWDAVQEINAAARKIAEGNRPPTEKLFSGKLVCSGCKGPLVGMTSTKRAGYNSGHGTYATDKRYVTYYCATYARTGHSVCSNHSISEITLKQIVIAEIRGQAQKVILNEDAMLQSLKQSVKGHNDDALAGVRQEIAQVQHRVRELEVMNAKLYEDKINGNVSMDTFAVMMQKNEQERLQKSERLAALQSEENLANQSTTDIQKWMKLIRKHADITDLDRDTVEELIDYIIVGEAQKIDGKRRRDITIHYRFVDAIG